MSSYLITLAAPAIAEVNIGEQVIVALKLGPSGPPLPSLDAYPPEAHAASHAADGDDPLTDPRLTDARTPTGPADGDLAGTYPAPTVGRASGAFRFTGIITPDVLSGSTDDWAPTGFSTSALVRASSSAAVNLTGLAGGASGMVVFLHNIGAHTITLKDESGSSADANRFALASDTDLAPDSILLLQYDTTSARWRACGGGVPTDFGQKAIWNYVPLERDITDAITLAAADNATWINGNKATDFTITIDGAVSLPPGFNFAIYQQGAGKITIAGTNGATLVNHQGATKTAGQYAAATVKRIGSTSTYVLMGTVQ